MPPTSRGRCRAKGVRRRHWPARSSAEALALAWSFLAGRNPEGQGGCGASPQDGPRLAEITLPSSPCPHVPSPATLRPCNSTPQTPTSKSTPDRRSDPGSRDWVAPGITFFRFVAAMRHHSYKYDYPWGLPSATTGRGKIAQAASESASNARIGGKSQRRRCGCRWRKLRRRAVFAALRELVAHTGFEPVVSALRERAITNGVSVTV